MEPVVKVQNLVKRYKEVIALEHLDLEVQKGEILGLLGPNGSGKTTAINCMLSLLKYDKGTIELFGKPMSPSAYDTKRRIGVVPQEVSVLEGLTVEENIDYFCGLYVDDAAQRKRLVEEAIAFVGIAEHRKFFPKKLSGGLKRRLNIACGIAHQPELIFLDEPTVAVDAQSRNFILEGIRNLNKQGSTIIYTTHYLEEVEMLCDRIVIMDKGRSIASGTKEQLKDMIRTGEKVVVEFTELSPEKEEALRALPGLLDMKKQGGEYELSFEKGRNNLLTLLSFADQNALAYNRLYTEEPSLNDVFLALTGKELRE